MTEGNQKHVDSPGVERVGAGVFRRYGKLAAGSVALAAVIAAVVAWLRPLDESSLETIQAPPVLTPPAAEPTVVLPSKAADVPAEELRAELFQLGEKLLAQFPTVPEALHVVAGLYADLQRVTEAERIWQDCIRLSPTHVGPYVGLATAAMEQGKDEQAVAILRQGTSAGCTSPELDHQLAAALTKLGRLEEAEKVLERGLAVFPACSENWLQLGQIQIQLSQFADAERSLRKAISNGSGDGSAYFSLATACARQGKQDEAAKYRQVFSQQKAEQDSAGDTPFQVRYDAQLRKIAIASICQAGTVYDRQGNPAEAERLMLRALALVPVNLTVCGELTAFYRRQRRIADARVVQRRMVDIQPGNAIHYVNLASLASQLGDYTAAEAALKQVVGMRPDLSVGYSGLARLYLQTGKLKQARWFAEAALRMEPTAPEETVQTYLVLAAVCQQLGDQPAAETALAEARKRSSPQSKPPPADLAPERAAGAAASQGHAKQP